MLGRMSSSEVVGVWLFSCWKLPYYYYLAASTYSQKQQRVVKPAQHLPHLRGNLKTKSL